MAVSAQRRDEDAPPTVMSAEMRAALVRDAIGRLTEGDCRKRVYDAALEQIRNAEAMAVSLAPPPGRFMR